MRETIIKARGYDPAISGDELSLKIASRPATARYLGERLKNEGDSLCELCCGVGVSLIELSHYFRALTGVDNDSMVIEDCRKNLLRAAVPNCSVVHGDVRDQKLLGDIGADIVLYDIPYWSSHAGRVNPEVQNPDLRKLVADIRALITDKIVIYAPRYMTHKEVELLLGPCEFVEVYVDGEHDRNFIFLGSLMKNSGSARVELS